MGDLVIIEIVRFDVILGMDCWNKTMVFKIDEEVEFTYHGDGLSSTTSILSTIMRKMV
jgi:hypothetical protein